MENNLDFLNKRIQEQNDYANGILKSDRSEDRKKLILESALNVLKDLTVKRNDLQAKIDRKVFLRKQAITVFELTKGYTPEQRQNFDNAMKTMEEMAGYVLELTN